MNPVLHQRDSRFVLFGLGVDKTSWRGVGLLAAVFFGSLLIAAVLTPPLYWLVQLWHDRTGSANAQWLLDKGVDVYFDRIRMAAIVLGLPWLMSKCHLWSWRAMGLAFKAGDASIFAKCWAGGCLLIVGLAILLPQPVWLTGQGPSFENINQGVLIMLTALAAGLLLGFLEEAIFRGMILRLFYTASKKPWHALVATSAFYAYTHFKVPTSVWHHVAPGVHWDTGLFVAFWTTFGITENFQAAQFVVLWLLGMILGTLTLRTGSLLPAIGLHAGIVSAMFFFRGAGLGDTWWAALALVVVLGALVDPKSRIFPTTPSA